MVAKIYNKVKTQRRMSDMKRLVVSLSVLALILGLSLDGQAQVGQAPEIRRGDFDLLWILRPPTQAELDALAENLQLTEEQRADMEQIHERHTAELRQLTQRYPEARQNLVSALQQQPRPDPARVENALRELDRLHSGILDREMKLWNALSNNLSREQTEEFWRLFGTRRVQGVGEARPPDYFR